MPTPHLPSPIAAEEIFRVAAALPAADRAAYLDAACEGQPTVRARVERLLEVGGIAALREELVAAHRERFGSNADADLYIGLQLTHSGRYARPDVHDRPSPIAACANPALDRRMGTGEHQGEALVRNLGRAGGDRAVGAGRRGAARADHRHPLPLEREHR